MCTLILLPCNGKCFHKNLGYYHLSLSAGYRTIENSADLASCLPTALFNSHQSHDVQTNPTVLFSSVAWYHLSRYMNYRMTGIDL